MQIQSYVGYYKFVKYFKGVYENFNFPEGD